MAQWLGGNVTLQYQDAARGRIIMAGELEALKLEDLWQFYGHRPAESKR
jgi:hypothetical protein